MIYINMANVSSYTFDNMSRIGLDPCCKSQTDIQNVESANRKSLYEGQRVICTHKLVRQSYQFIQEVKFVALQYYCMNLLR
jgi:hypothetical protein